MERIKNFFRNAADARADAVQGFLSRKREEGDAIGQPIGKKEISKAREILDQYRRGKQALEQRIVENERWYQLRHWEALRGRERREPNTSSAWLFNAIANKHADAMDNIPEPVVLAREESDEAAAETLSSVLPVVLEQNSFEAVYSDEWWYKLKTGTGVYGVFWDSSKLNGVGDIDIKQIDLLNLFWEPGITDIQESQNVFLVDLVPNDVLEMQYPQLIGKMGGKDFDVAHYYMDDNVDTSQMSIVIDWYYKRSVNGRDVVHFCKFCGSEVLYASENQEMYAQRGHYDHGKYPFIFDVLFPEAGTPIGFGYIDICKGPQNYIDALDRAIMRNAMVNAKPRFFRRGEGSVNAAEYADLRNDFVTFHGGGNPQDSIFPIQPPSLPAAVLTVRQEKIEELKETSGNRDFSQGGTSSGVTAASAIAALQEAGSKLSRDMIKATYRVHAKLCTMCIELMRQFYTEDRYFRITGPNGAPQFVSFGSTQIAAQAQYDTTGIAIGERLPVFDVRIVAQKSSPFATAAQNERAKELYSMGFFLPQNADQSLAALDMMQFEGIDKVRKRVSENGTLFQTVQQLQMQFMQLAAIVDAQNGSTIAQGAAQTFAGQQGAPVITGGRGGETEVNALGNAIGKTRGNSAGGARATAARSATPR